MVALPSFRTASNLISFSNLAFSSFGFTLKKNNIKIFAPPTLSNLATSRPIFNQIAVISNRPLTAITMKCKSQNCDDAVSAVDKMTYREMQKMCSQMGVPARGKADAVRDRLVAALKSSPGDNATAPAMESDEKKVHDLSKFAFKEDPGEEVGPEKFEQQPQRRSSWRKRELEEPPPLPPNTPSAQELETHQSPEKISQSKNDEKSVTNTPKGKKSPKPRTSSSRKRQRIEAGSLPPPKNWEILYSIVEELRQDRTAPLDSDGGEALPERHLGEKVYRFQVLVALMLSSQTKDAVVGSTMRALQEHGLTVENIHRTESQVLNSLINKVGFHNNKTKFLKQAAKTILTDFDGDIPPTADDMMKLSGVGPKMAYIIESIAFGVSTGIGVDTHMHRMFNDIKWVKSKTPEQTREQLEGWLPKEKWGEVNMLWVGFGQESQQQKEKILKKALACSRPVEALGLLKKVGLNLSKEGKKYGLEEEINAAYDKEKLN